MATPTAFRVAESGFRRYKHTWRASLFSSFVNPVMLLLAMGIGLGTLVDRSGGPAGLDYVTWLAPGLLANIGMQTAAGESAYPVMAGMRWIKSYDAMLAAPLKPSDIVLGHFTWVTVRLIQVTVIFAAVAVWLADLDPVRTVAATGAAVLTGMAFIGAVTFYTAKFNNETSLSNLFRYVVVPLFLFSGVFFPVSQLPGFLQPLAWLTPLWHGVELTRWLGLGLNPAFAPTVHVGFLVAVTVVGVVYAIRQFEARLVK
ncbi:MAG: ABC transporter permease [Acidimicrobiia bacterium]|nr:ABC transporter permease [Acidimicrobiia bacterium]